ncbi:MAG: lipid-A-disaccharide synthase [Flavobacteriales bacterium]|nr:lipid-A-disaccharide synthase [Flavobacteriales bacterium]
MNYYIIAGEASGDLHASNLIKELKKRDVHAKFRGWGGDLMQQQGTELVKHYKELAFMGFVEVVLNLKTILKNLSFCKKDILENRPDVLILVDYPGFNLKIAKWAKENQIRVFYYISPQIWAWKQNRVHQIKQNVDKMFVILPFEKEFYKKFNVDVDFVGHPLLDAIAHRNPSDLNDFCVKNNLPNKPIIALLPGSRAQEISKMLPIMLSVVNRFPDFQFVVAGAPSQHLSFYKQFLNGQVSLVENQTYSLLEHSTAALVTSGTATLETALFGVPQVVCYKGSFVSYYIAKMIIKVGYISLVNLISDKEIVKELIQNELNTETLAKELTKIISENKHNELKIQYQELQSKLGGYGASSRTADLIYNYLKLKSTC